MHLLLPSTSQSAHNALTSSVHFTFCSKIQRRTTARTQAAKCTMYTLQWRTIKVKWYTAMQLRTIKFTMYRSHYGEDEFTMYTKLKTVKFALHTVYRLYSSAWGVSKSHCIVNPSIMHVDVRYGENGHEKCFVHVTGVMLRTRHVCNAMCLWL